MVQDFLPIGYIPARPAVPAKGLRCGAVDTREASEEANGPTM
jgi:hypothetical protein